MAGIKQYDGFCIPAGTAGINSTLTSAIDVKDIYNTSNLFLCRTYLTNATQDEYNNYYFSSTDYDGTPYVCVARSWVFYAYVKHGWYFDTKATDGLHLYHALRNYRGTSLYTGDYDYYIFNIMATEDGYLNISFDPLNLKVISNFQLETYVFEKDDPFTPNINQKQYMKTSYLNGAAHFKAVSGKYYTIVCKFKFSCTTSYEDYWLYRLSVNKYIPPEIDTHTIKARHKLARRTEAEWKTKDPVLLEGELAFTSDKDDNFKIGDGVLLWSELPYHKTPTKVSELENDSKYLTSADVSNKQDTLVSGTNIKTINGESILGSGNLEVGGGGSAVEIDKTLTIEDAAADAKAVGDAIEDLRNGEIYLKYESSLSYLHTNLNTRKNIAIFKNDLYSVNPQIFFSKNYFPVVKYWDRPMPYRDTIFSSNDGYNISVTGTPSASAQAAILDGKDGSIYFPIPEDWSVGDAIKIHEFRPSVSGSRVFTKIIIYDINKSSLLSKQVSIDPNNNYNSTTFTVPSGATYISYHISIANDEIGIEHDDIIFPIIAKSNTIIKNDIAFNPEGKAIVDIENDYTEFFSIPYLSSVNATKKIKDYIDESSSSADIDLDVVDERLGFLSPEMFGAKGDGDTDDSVAINTCINKAIETHTRVIASKDYLISQPIEIYGNLINIEINYLKYTGLDAAIIIDGAQNTVKANYIISNGTGIRLTTIRTTGGTGHHNNISVTNIESQKHCIEISAVNRSITSNIFSFNKLAPNDNYNCINLVWGENLYIAQNQYNGGQCVSGNWAIYNAGEKDVANEFHLEGVKNGYYCKGESFRINGGRYVELINSNWGDGHGHYTSGIFDSSKGTLLHLPARINEFFIAGGSRIYPSSFNFESVATDSYTWTDGTGTTIPYKSEAFVSKLNIPLRSLSGEKFADDFLLFCNHIIIKNPTIERIMEINSSNPEDYNTWKDDFDYCKWLRLYSDFYINENCEFTLPPSYDSIGYNKFKVHQINNKSVVLKDWRGTTVFDGSQYGDGSFEIMITIQDTAREDDYNNRYQVWKVRQINNL